ncbi:hypothetical protein GJAV_G00183610 [Gymnothorax javanicus]|nr:hypothetical protein GJAV_G00183610 [Gymnothorax javanicus]
MCERREFTRMQWFASLSIMVLLWSQVLTAPGSWRVRLVEDGHWRGCSGLVELYITGTWRRLCSNRLHPRAAQLVCQDTGCGDERYMYHKEGESAILGVHLLCRGNESTLLHCLSRSLFESCALDTVVVCTAFHFDATLFETWGTRVVRTTSKPLGKKRTTTLTPANPSCSCATGPAAMGLFPVLYTSLVLIGLAVMVAAILAVEVVAKRRRALRRTQEDSLSCQGGHWQQPVEGGQRNEQGPRPNWPRSTPRAGGVSAPVAGAGQ